jgi:hypothetical protein
VSATRIPPGRTRSRHLARLVALSSTLMAAGCTAGCTGLHDGSAHTEAAPADAAPGADTADAPLAADSAPAVDAADAGHAAQGWQVLFDGTDTSAREAWTGYGREEFPAGWEVQDGGLARTGPGGDLVSVESYEDFELGLEWRVAPGGNSGIFFHVGDGRGAVWETGPEMQVLDNAGHPDGRHPRTSAGANYALHAPARDATRPPGEWNRVRLVVDRGHVEHWLNGHLLLQYRLGSDDWRARVAASKFAAMPDYGRLGRGRIALQDHGDPVWYRDIRIRRL